MSQGLSLGHGQRAMSLRDVAQGLSLGHVKRRHVSS
jgi:hypothetical protein